MKALLPRHHTGKLAEHTHTSYAGLAFLLIVAALVVAAFGAMAQAGEGDTSGGGSAGIFASVPAKVPDATTIASPKSGTQVDTIPLTVSGACTAGALVKVFKNGVVAGATTCKPSGSYSLPIDLFFGTNTLIAQAYNIQDVSGPSSLAVGVQFVPASGPLATQFQHFDDSTAAANQLFVKADAFHQAIGAEDTQWKLELVGGTAPYAVTVSWGDGKSSVYSRMQGGFFDVRHRYASRSGNFDVVVKVADSTSKTAFIQLVAVGTTVAAAGGQAAPSRIIAVAWPILVLMAAVVAAFWVGERYEKRLLRKRQTMGTPA